MTYIKNKNKHLLGRSFIIVKTNDEKLDFHVYHIFNLFFNREVKVVHGDNNNLDLRDGSDEVSYEINFDRINATSDEEENNYFYGNLEIKSFKNSSTLNKQAKRKYEIRDKEDIKRSVYSYIKEQTNRTLPWGTLIGVRPSKFAYKMIKENRSFDEIKDFYKRNYLLSDNKIDLIYKTALNESRFLKEFKEDETGLYIHMPFCPTKCTYCSFISLSCGSKEVENLRKEYVKILIREIKETQDFLNKNNLKVRYIYFGGGTPTSVTDTQFEEILKVIDETVVKTSDIFEYTVECGRVDSLSYKKLLDMKNYSVTRLSINPQTFSDNTLKDINRNHSSKDIIEWFNKAREVGFDNINMDIIVGLPKETLKDVENTMKNLMILKPENITIHGLSLKRGAALSESEHVNKNIEVEKMYESIYKTLQENKYMPYYLYRQKNIIGNLENVGFSKEGFENYYNIAMMEDRDSIISCGSSAVSKKVIKDNDKLKIERYEAYRDVKRYIDNIDEVLKEKFSLYNKVME